MMSFSTSPLYSTAEEIRRAAPGVKDTIGETTTEAATLSSAGQEMYCFERSWESGQLREMTRSLSMADLTCVPLSDKRLFSATYMGSRDLAPEFYSLLKGVRLLDKVGKPPTSRQWCARGGYCRPW